MAEDLAEFRRTNISEVVRAKNTLEATLEALPDAVVLLDAGGQIQSMNRAAVRALASAGVHEPRCLADLRVDGLDLQAVSRAIAAGSSVQPPADLTRTIRVEQDGAVQRLLPRVVPVPALNPQQRGAILLLYDVTDLVRLDEMRSELVAVASHELQTPLTTLRMTLLMLQEASDMLPERQRQLVATSLIGVEQLTETVHEFLDLTRIEAGELRLNLEPVRRAGRDCGGVSVVSRTRRRRRAITLSSRVDSNASASGRRPASSPCRVRQHPVERARSTRRAAGASRSRVMASLAVARPSRVRRCRSASRTQVLASPPRFVSRIFDKFFRLEHHHTEVRPGARGAGIGLYMCRQIVELHGGHIACDAGADERGTRITVTLPAKMRDAAVVNDGATYASR